MKLRTLQEIPDLKGKRVFVRVDFNVPLDAQGYITDDKRIQHALPTLKYLLENGAEKLILATHIGRPKDHEVYLKTDVQAARLAELLGVEVQKLDGWTLPLSTSAQVIMLENLRFHPGEKSKDEQQCAAFGKQLADLADLYVNEAFSNSHRSHASMTEVPQHIPGYAGFGVQKEVEAISNALEDPEHPVVAIIGGLKADKLVAIGHLLPLVDHVLVAGALACNLLKAQGYEVGASKIDNEGMEEKATLASHINANKKVILPEDFVVADSFSAEAEIKVVRANKIEPGWMALDIGPVTTGVYLEMLRKAKTILWFGPIGVFEMPPFAKGTEAIGRTLAELKALTIIGGGDSASAVKKLGLEGEMSLVSTGGGASLEMIEGKSLPALEILRESN